MNALFYFMCAHSVLRAYADACENGAEFCEYTAPSYYIESELDE